MSARLVGCVCGGPPRPESDYLLWFVVFAVLRVCPRCLRDLEIPIALKFCRPDPVLVVMALNTGVVDIPAFDHEVGHTASSTCPGCGETLSVTDRDISREVMDQAIARVIECNRETTNDILKAHGIPPVYPESEGGAR